MFAKLALRNVKRQLSNYLIYFITVSHTVSLMFALCNLIFSEQLLNYAQKLKDLQSGLITIAVAVTVIVAIVLGYASSYMLKLRKREFGTYLTLGMTRRNILKMFTIENLSIGLVALGCGILFGLILFQGMIGLVAYVMDLKISLGSYSVMGLVLTVGLTTAMYLLSSVSSALYLKKVSIYELLHAEKQVDKRTKHPYLWMLITIASLAAVVISIVGANTSISTMFVAQDQGSSSAASLFGYIALLLCCMAIYHVGFSKSIMYILLKSKKLKSNNTNTFVLRQLSGQMNANSALCGMLAFLFTLTIICTNVAFGQKTTVNHYLDKDFPFDITVDLDRIENGAPYTYEEGLSKVEEYVAVLDTIPYTIYTSGNGYLHSFTPWTGADYEHLYDSFIRESVFNQLITSLGYQPVTLEDECLVLMVSDGINRCDFTNVNLQIEGKNYRLREVTDQYPYFIFTYFLTVVPDEATLGMEVETKKIAIDLENKEFSAQQLNDALTYTQENTSGYLVERCPFNLRAYYELEENSLTAILIVGELYMAIVFVFMTVAILTMKILSGLSEDKKRYELLYKLGVSKQERKKALFKQTFTLFTFPVLLPILASIPVAYLCGRIVEFGGYHVLVPQMYGNAAMIAIVLVLIQLLYFAATYSIQKKENA